MVFADIHNHSLASVDDGPQSESTMYQMVDAAYADGIRVLCLTPHFYPGVFGDNRDAVQDSFEKLRNYAAQNYPQLQIHLGNELRYSPNCDNWLREGLCRTLDGADLVLVDFSTDASRQLITRGLKQILSMGYHPILAHAERYSNLSVTSIREFRENGIRIQINAGSLTGSFGFGSKLRARLLLKNRLICIVASDAHNLRQRPPLLTKGYHIATRITDAQYAERIFYHNIIDLLNNNREGLVQENE